jgi:hypothetical protein
MNSLHESIVNNDRCSMSITNVIHIPVDSQTPAAHCHTVNDEAGAASRPPL